jgi:hypothetical protein
MIQDKEVAMVHAADYALEYLNKHPQANAEIIIKDFLKTFESKDIQRDMKIYSIAAISDIIKIKENKENRGKLKKQLLQIFIKNVPLIISRIEEGNED